MPNFTMSKEQIEEFIIVLTEQRNSLKQEELNGRTKYIRAYANRKLKELRDIIIILQDSIKDEMVECELSYYRLVGQYENLEKPLDNNGV